MEQETLIWIILIGFAVNLIIFYWVIRLATDTAEQTKYARMTANFMALLCKKMGVTKEELKAITDEVDPEKKDFKTEYIY